MCFGSDVFPMEMFHRFYLVSVILLFPHDGVFFNHRSDAKVSFTCFSVVFYLLQSSVCFA